MHSEQLPYHATKNDESMSNQDLSVLHAQFQVRHGHGKWNSNQEMILYYKV